MARIRSVKPDLFSSFTLANVSIHARFLFIGLFTEADDEGRMIDSPKKLTGSLFPHDENVTEKKVEGWLKELEAQGCIVRYTAGHGRYLALPEWKNHQRVSHPLPSKIPSPSETLPNISGESRETFRPELEGEGEGEGEQGSALAASDGASSFDEFWDIYPQRNGKKLGKGKATAKWLKLKPSEQSLAMEAVKNYRAAIDAGLTLAKDPERWLRDKCWDDWLEPADDPKSDPLAHMRSLISERESA